MEKFSEITVGIGNINRAINKIKRERLAQSGIRNAHLTCMMYIDLETDGLTPTEISKCCTVDKGFVSRITADLIKCGFICTNSKFHDGRKYRNKYILTETGKSLISDIQNAVEEYFIELGAKIDEHEMKSFLNVITSINSIIENKSRIDT